MKKFNLVSVLMLGIVLVMGCTFPVSPAVKEYVNVTLNLNYEGSVNIVEIIEKNSIIAVNAPDIAMKRFVGWRYEDGEMYNNEPISENIILYAEWEFYIDEYDTGYNMSDIIEGIIPDDNYLYIYTDNTTGSIALYKTHQSITITDINSNDLLNITTNDTCKMSIKYINIDDEGILSFDIENYSLRINDVDYNNSNPIDLNYYTSGMLDLKIKYISKESISLYSDYTGKTYEFSFYMKE